MASNIFGRYVWLLETLRQHKKLTFDEINQLWQRSGLSYGEGDKLALRTFHNHRAAIFDIFQVDIKCDTKDGYKYYIEHLERLQKDRLRCWLIDSYSMLNPVQHDRLIGTISKAIQQTKVLEIIYLVFGVPHPNTFEIEPYYLQLVRQHWYLIARHIEQNVFLIYSLDRITKLHTTEKNFVLDEEFSIDAYFNGCCGLRPYTSHHED